MNVLDIHDCDVCVKINAYWYLRAVKLGTRLKPQVSQVRAQSPRIEDVIKHYARRRVAVHHQLVVRRGHLARVLPYGWPVGHLCHRATFLHARLATGRVATLLRFSFLKRVNSKWPPHRVHV